MSRIILTLAAALTLFTACDAGIGDLTDRRPPIPDAGGPGTTPDKPLLAPYAPTCAQVPAGTYVLHDGHLMICGTNGPRG